MSSSKDATEKPEPPLIKAEKGSFVQCGSIWELREETAFVNYSILWEK